MSDNIEYPDDSWLSEALLRVRLERTRTQRAEGGELNLLEVPPSKQFKHVRVWTYLFHCYLWLTIDGKTGPGNSGPIAAIQCCLRARDELEGIKAEMKEAESFNVPSKRRQKLEELELKFQRAGDELEQECRGAISRGFPGIKSAESFLMLWAVSLRPYVSGDTKASLHSDLLQIVEDLGFGSETRGVDDAKGRIQKLKTYFDKFEYPDYAFVHHESKNYHLELAEFDNDPEVSHPIFRRNGQPWSWKTPKEIATYQTESLADELMYASVLLRIANQVHPVVARKYLHLSWKLIEKQQKELRDSIKRLYQLENENDTPLSVNDKLYCKVWVLRELHGLTFPEALGEISSKSCGDEEDDDEMQPSSFRSSSRRFFEETALKELEKRANYPGGLYQLELYMRQPSLLLHFPSFEQLQASRLDLDA